MEKVSYKMQSKLNAVYLNRKQNKENGSFSSDQIKLRLKFGVLPS